MSRRLRIRLLHRIESLQFDTRISGAELPVDRADSLIAMLLPALNLVAELPVRKLARAQIRANEYTKSRREQSGEHCINNKVAAGVLVKLELLPVTNYLPDVELIKKNEVRVFIAVGEWALERKTWYVQAAQILAEKLGCELVTFPSHHGSYMDMPEEWAATLRNVLHKAEE